MQNKNVMYAIKHIIYVYEWKREAVGTVVWSFSLWGEQLIVPCDDKETGHKIMLATNEG